MSSQEPIMELYSNYTTGESGWTNEFNYNMDRIAVFLQCAVIRRDLTVAPGSPVNGDRYLVASPATGVWAGKEKNIAVYRSAVPGWEFLAPGDGWQVVVIAESIMLTYLSGAWGNFVIPGAGTMSTQNANAVAITGGTIINITDLTVADGGTGASTASGARTNLGLGTMATQAASAVAVTGGTITGITDLAVADGGTGSSTASGARTNLGLGTISTQDASAVAITGGTINGTTLGVTTPAAAKVTTFDASGNINLSGASQRITADFSNGTFASRAWVQTSTPNSTTSFGVISNGSSTNANITVLNSSDPANGAFLTVAAGASSVNINSGSRGTGVVQPLVLNVNGTDALIVSTAQNVGIGLSPNTDCKLQVSNGIKVGNSANAIATVFDWYEEGIGTPVVTGLSTAGSGAYTKQEHSWTRRGNRVEGEITVGWSAHSGTGTTAIGPLPFTANSTTNRNHSASIFVNGMPFTISNTLQANIVPGETIIRITERTPAGSSAAHPIDAAVTTLNVSYSYEV